MNNTLLEFKEPIKNNMKHYYYMDFLRIIASFGVVISHTGSYWNDVYEINGFNWWVIVFFASLTRFAVPIFFMISGLIFLNPDREVTFKRLYCKHIKKLAVVFIFWSFIYAITNTIDNYGFNINFSSIKYAAKLVIQGPYTFWFLFVMIGIYIIVPLLRPIAANRTLLKYFLAISFITSILLPTIRIVPIIGQRIFNYSQRFEINIALGYVFYFVLGYYLHTIKISKKKANLSLVLSLLFVLITTLLTGYISIAEGKTNTILYEKLLLNNMIAAIGVFCFIQSKENCFNAPKIKNILKQMPMYTLGVYAMHPLLLDSLAKLGLFKIVTPSMGIPIISIIAYILCLFITYIIYKLLPKPFHILV